MEVVRYEGQGMAQSLPVCRDVRGPGGARLEACGRSKTAD